MKTLFTSLAIVSVAFSAVVSATNVQLRPADNSFETKVCFAAATQGLNVAYDLIKESDENFSRFTESLKCNGKSLIRATKSFQNTTLPEESKGTNNVSVRAVKFVTDDAAASKTCLDAVTMGAGAALKKNGMQNNKIYCNNLEIRTFAKKFVDVAVKL